MTRTTHTLNHPARSLGAAAAAAYLGVSRSSLDHSRLTGELLGIPAPQYARAGRTIRYMIDDLDEWLDALPRYRHAAEEAVGGRQ